MPQKSVDTEKIRTSAKKAKKDIELARIAGIFDILTKPFFVLYLSV